MLERANGTGSGGDEPPEHERMRSREATEPAGAAGVGRRATYSRGACRGGWQTARLHQTLRGAGAL